MTISEHLLAAIKQQSQFIKSELRLPYAQAMEVTASINGFANWHELDVIAKTNPFDSRLLGAALNRRAAPGIRSPSAIEAALRSIDRIAGDYPAVDPLSVFLKSRGFAKQEEVAPAFHVDLPAADSDRIQANLFAPTPRMVIVAGQAGAGKSMMALNVSAKQLAAGGAACIIDLFHNGRSVPSEQDLATRLKLALMDCYRSHLATEDLLDLPERFSRFTHLGPADSHSPWPLPPLEQHLASIRARLLPFSLLVLDEVEYMLERCKGTDLAKAVLELKRIRQDGHAVVLVTQSMAGSIWHSLATDIGESGVVILGRSSRWMFDRDDDQIEQIVQASAQLRIDRGRSAQYLFSGSGLVPGLVTLTPEDIVPHRLTGFEFSGMASIGNDQLSLSGDRDAGSFSKEGLI